MVVLTRSEVLKHGISLQTELEPGLPMVEGDRTQLQQVILNLILNAAEAIGGIAEGTRELRINTEREAAGGVLVTVRDSGPGLDPADVERVFQAFYTTKAKGMGMGLAICRSMVEAHGGRMWASANEPRGAVFQFTLPLQRDESVPAQQVRPKPAA
jgi:signal transduction histidine kinase